MQDSTLVKEIGSRVGSFLLNKINIPDFITKNIKYELFEWQKSALQHFIAYENPDYDLVSDLSAPTHLLFNMATGTGKTLLMATLLLYYYNKGYRHFIFFVNQNNIVGKTEENLTNPNHSKYLFKQNIVIENRTVNIKKVETFSVNSNDIQILFTSIHRLHNAVYSVKENSVYLDDLQKLNIVMIGDEAHHLNADTKKKKNEQEEFELPTVLSEKVTEAVIEKSWEDTVINKILYKGLYPSSVRNKNVLLEFTATVPKDKAVEEKYHSKIIYQFDLKDFLKAGYTKEINLVSSSFDKQRRILQALIFNWYRTKIALKYNVANFKPVILFRSKFIETSKKDFEDFKVLIKNLSVKDISFINKYVPEKILGKEIYEKGKSRILDIKSFINENDIALSEIVSYLQYNFSERNCIITNSKTGTKTIEKTNDEQEKLLNSLEDKNNHITAIFTVQRLTEGWDVLNLFDIVRLYEGQNEGGSNTKTSAATTSEVQLIGRGVRYFPFIFKDKPLRKRKFDDDLQHELRVLEEFYYHSDSEHRYLSELKNELKSKGYIDDKKISKTFSLKNDFKNSSFYKKIRLWINEQKDNPQRRKKTLNEIIESVSGLFLDIQEDAASEIKIEMDKTEDTTRYATSQIDRKTIPIKLNQLNKHIVIKALNIVAKKDSSILKFNYLKNELSINSVEEILTSNMLGDVTIDFIVPKSVTTINEINPSQILKVLLTFFDRFEKSLKEFSNPYIGSDFFGIKFNSVFEDSKEKLIIEDEESKSLEKELKELNWYVLDSFNGTSEERNLIYFLKDTIGNLEERYEQVYLLRNEEVYSIYDFKKGRGFQPDFLLFLKKKNKNLYYQVFIEPKGSQFEDESGRFDQSKEGWKEEFLKEITDRYKASQILKYESNEYTLIGLPLYNEKRKTEFKSNYNLALEL
jgi:type III restriction enzyme